MKISRQQFEDNWNSAFDKRPFSGIEYIRECLETEYLDGDIHASDIDVNIITFYIVPIDFYPKDKQADILVKRFRILEQMQVKAKPYKVVFTDMMPAIM